MRFIQLGRVSLILVTIVGAGHFSFAEVESESPFSLSPEKFDETVKREKLDRAQKPEIPPSPSPTPQEPAIPEATAPPAPEPSPVLPEEVDVPPVLETIDGAVEVKVKTPNGTERKGHAGDFLFWGESFELNPEATARIIFEGGGQALISGGSEVLMFQDAQEGAALSPGLELKKGRVRILVPTGDSAGSQLQMSLPRDPYRFYIRTKAAVMGVRGTDFLVGSDGLEMTLHTFSGTVDVAPDVSLLRGGAGQSVRTGNFTESLGASGKHVIQKVALFNMGIVVGDLRREKPGMEKVWREALKDQTSGRLMRKFESIRLKSTEDVQMRRGIIPERIKKEQKPLPPPPDAAGGALQAPVRAIAPVPRPQGDQLKSGWQGNSPVEDAGKKPTVSGWDDPLEIGKNQPKLPDFRVTPQQRRDELIKRRRLQRSIKPGQR